MMRSENQVNLAISSLKQGYEDACNNNRSLNAKIDALKEAKACAKNARQEAKGAWKSVKNYKVPDRWKGKLSEEFENRIDNTIAVQAKTFYDRIGDMVDDINAEITKLRKKKNYFVEIISSFQSNLQALQNELNQINEAKNNGGGGGAW